MNSQLLDGVSEVNSSEAKYSLLLLCPQSTRSSGSEASSTIHSHHSTRLVRADSHRWNYHGC